MTTILEKLHLLGYAYVCELVVFAYTNGVTYTFKKGTYFVCRVLEGTGPIFIYNAKLKKLGNHDGDACLYFKEAMPTNPNETDTMIIQCARKHTKTGHQTFNLFKVQALVDAFIAGTKIHEICGISPVFVHDAPSKSGDILHYAIEMKIDRDVVTETNRLRIGPCKDEWKILECDNGGRGKRERTWSDAQHSILAMFQIRKFDGAIRNKYSGKILCGASRLTLCGGMIDNKRIMITILRHRAYACTWMIDERRDGQNHVDHIDGDNTNNNPSNLRWAHESDNQLAKHSGMSDQVNRTATEILGTVRDMTGAKVWNTWTVYPNDTGVKDPSGTYYIPRTRPKRYPKIAPTLRETPTNKLKEHSIYCHRLKAFVFRIKTSELACTHLVESMRLDPSHFDSYGATYFEYVAELTRCKLHIMHLDGNKSNHQVKNLMIGTHSENGIARHADPATTGMKRVHVLDTKTGATIEFASQKECAAWFGMNRAGISDTVRINRTRDVSMYQKTTHKKLGIKYFIVDAITSGHFSWSFFLRNIIRAKLGT